MKHWSYKTRTFKLGLCKLTIARYEPNPHSKYTRDFPSTLTIRLALPLRRKVGEWYDIMSDEMMIGTHILGRMWEAGWSSETRKWKFLTRPWHCGVNSSGAVRV